MDNNIDEEKNNKKAVKTKPVKAKAVKTKVKKEVPKKEVKTKVKKEVSKKEVSKKEVSKKEVSKKVVKTIDKNENDKNENDKNENDKNENDKNENDNSLNKKNKDKINSVHIKNKKNSKNDVIIKPFNKELLTYFVANKKNNTETNNNIKKYQNSFDDIIHFSKSITSIDKKSINCIIYHADNSDGIMSANIVIKYLLENKTADDVVIIPAKPSSGAGFMNKRLEKHENDMKGRNVIIIDLQYNKENLQYIHSHAKNVIIIDDHPIGHKEGNKHFIGNNSHASVAYTWKFFYPNKDVPLYAQIIDNDDRKLQLPHLSKYRNMSSFYNYRIFHNPYLQKFGIHFDKISDFELLDSVIIDEYKNISNIIGHYYDELANNIKEQVARNARFAYFEGHPVYVLNYNDPVLSRMVARQMLSNAKMQGVNIDFAVLWGYEYTNQCYRVQLAEFHGGNPKFNLPYIAKTLGNIGGTGKGGGGAQYVGNFYWPRSREKDIWDLFSKEARFIKQKFL